jgi:hypothetical protein
MSDPDRGHAAPPMSERLLRGLFVLLFAIVYDTKSVAVHRAAIRPTV